MSILEAPRTTGERRLRLIDADPELFEGVNGSAPPRAVESLTVAVVAAAPGPWRVRNRRRDERIGMLVLEGLVACSLTVAGQRRAELVGPGDVIRPWDDAAEELARVRPDVSWTVLEPARLAELDAAFVRSAALVPDVLAELVQRALDRTRRIALQLAICEIRRVDERLLALFAHLGDRWGRVTPDGTHVPVRLTHELLAQLVGAQRPTVTTSLGELRRQDRLVKRADRTWLLRTGA